MAGGHPLFAPEQKLQKLVNRVRRGVAHSKIKKFINTLKAEGPLGYRK